MDEAVAALALVPDMPAAKEVLSLQDLSHFTLLPTGYLWGDVLFSTDPATKAGLHAVRNTLALRRLSPDAPALGRTNCASCARGSCVWPPLSPPSSSR